VSDKGKLEATTPALDVEYAKKIIKATEATGALKFDPMDLVANRIPTAAREMGGDVSRDFEPEAVNAKLAKGETVEIPVTGWSWNRAGVSRRTGASGSFTRWSDLWRDKRVRTDPHIVLGYDLNSESLANIDKLIVTPRDLVRRTHNGQEIFALDTIAFSAYGGEHFSGMLRGSKPPATFKIIYSFAG
jgi:hypothetical protein